MKWEVPYVVFRPKGAGRFEEVFQTGDFKKAKYWMTYIAEIGDVLCKTVAHQRYTGNGGQPEYFSHKEDSGTVKQDLSSFEQSVLAGSACNFPAEAVRSPNDYQTV